MALFAVGALFAGGAWAQGTLTQSVANAYLVAEELLGSADGTVIKLSSAATTATAGTAAQPAVKLTVGGQGVEADNTAEVTFNLTGAAFGQNVGSSTLDLRNSDGSSSTGLATEVISGGATGDASVTFLIEATSTINADQYLAFWVPDLSVTPTTVGLTAAGKPIMGASISATMKERRAVKGSGTGPFAKVMGAEDTITPKANNVANRQVVALADVVAITLGANGAATVALNARTAFSDSNATYRPQGSKTVTKALKVGSLAVTINGGGTPTDGTAAVAGQVFTLDPTKPAVDYNDTAVATDDELDNSLAGNVDVVIKGAFKTGDMVVYGATRTPAKISGGMAAVSVPIALGGAATDFIYVPGGVDALRPGNIAAVASLNFSRAGNAAGKPAMSAGVISYAGVGIEAYAHGVVRGGGTDSSYLRVRCANATDCTVFLDCHDQAGMNYFDEAGDVPAGGTAVWSSDAVATVLGGGWSGGRGACDLLSNGTLEVQHMVRSHGILINNSAVIGRSLSEMRLDSIDKAIADICSSVVGYKARAGNNGNNTPDDATDDVSKVAASMCNNYLAVPLPDGTDTDDDPSNGT